MIRNTFTQSGELAIISGVKFFVPKFIKSLQVRVTVILSVFVILSSVILMNAILQSYDQRTVSVRTAEIQNQCTILSNQLVNSDYLKTGVSDVIDTELSQLSNIYNGRVLVIDDEFRIVEDTYDLEEGKTIISEDVVKCFRGEKPASYDRKSRYIEVAVPVKKGEEPVKGMILVSVSTDSLRDNVEALQTKARIATVAISIIGIFLSAIIGMLLVRPLKRMSQSIEEMAGGYGDNYLHENAYDETDRISNAFNKLWDRYKVLDASREEFVANVSHELKTPLTSISGYAEIMMNGLVRAEDIPGFSKRIYKEARRLITLVEDIIKLSKLDEESVELEKEDVELYELTREIVSRLSPQCSEKKISVALSGEPVFCHGIRQILDEMIYNITENAIKYNRDGGSVSVWVGNTLDGPKISVSDTGIGIPEEHQERIFERFYRVDKSHSKERGGTGLGLSIVKHGAILHGAKVTVSSEPGKGTKIEIRFPKEKKMKKAEVL